VINYKPRLSSITEDKYAESDNPSAEEPDENSKDNSEK
jgi:hypothetical protein